MTPFFVLDICKVNGKIHGPLFNVKCDTVWNTTACRNNYWFSGLMSFSWVMSIYKVVNENYNGELYDK